MSHYFHISSGLLGGYIPDSSYMLRCETRRELKSAIEGEAYGFTDAGYKGASKRAIAGLAADAWREAGKARPSYLPLCLSLAAPHNLASYSHGIFIALLTPIFGRECLAHQESEP